MDIYGRFISGKRRRSGPSGALLRLLLQRSVVLGSRRQLWGTLLPFAYASIADVETFRKCIMKHAATRQIFPKRPFKSIKPAGFQARLALQSFSVRNQSKNACVP